MLVFPDSHVTWRNAPGGDRGSLDDHQTNSAHGPTPEVDQVKIIGEAVRQPNTCTLATSRFGCGK